MNKNLFRLILIIFILINVAHICQSAETGLPSPGLPSPGSPSPSAKSSKGHERSDLEINISSDKDNVNRTDSLNINYTIKSVTNDVHNVEVIIKIPNYFENVKQIRISKNADYEWEYGDNLITFKCDKLTKNNIAYISYNCEISPDARTDRPVLLDAKTIKDIKWDFKKNYKTDSKQINISNIEPDAEGLSLSCDSDQLCYPFADKVTDYTIFKDELIYIICNGSDLDGDILKYKLIINNESAAEKFADLGSTAFPFLTNQSGKYEIKFMLFDEDNASSCSNIITIQVLEKSHMDWSSQRYMGYLIFMSIETIIICYLFIKRVPFHLDLIIVFVILWALLVIIIEEFRTVPYYELSLYAFILVFAIYFISGNVPNDQSKRLWIISILGMLISGIIVIRFLPQSELFIGLMNKNDPTNAYNYIFWYYSMISQVFGTILAIVVAFTIWYLQEKKVDLKTSQEYKFRIRNFIILYMSIISLSITGLIIGKIPPLNTFYKIHSALEGLSILTLECTLVLIVPAFACLYGLTIWIIELGDNIKYIQEVNHSTGDYPGINPEDV